MTQAGHLALAPGFFSPNSPSQACRKPQVSAEQDLADLAGERGDRGDQRLRMQLVLRAPGNLDCVGQGETAKKDVSEVLRPAVLGCFPPDLRFPRTVERRQNASSLGPTSELMLGPARHGEGWRDG